MNLGKVPCDCIHTLKRVLLFAALVPVGSKRQKLSFQIRWASFLPAF